MKNVRTLAAGLLTTVCVACEIEQPLRADRIYTGGLIYTGVEEGETVEAVATFEGQILYAGSLENAVSVARSEADVIDLAGTAMYPGFVDSHAHLSGIGQRELTLNLDDVQSIAELTARVETAVQDSADGTVLVGRGWIETHWPEQRFPTASDLDGVSGDLPVILIRADGHALVANTAALDASGIGDDTVDPPGGRIERDASGAATGMLIDAAMGKVLSLVADPTPEQMARAVTVGSEVYAARGWTGLHNMSVGAVEADAIERLAIDGSLPIRVYNALDPDLLGRAATNRRFGLATTRAVKIYMDGALGSRGALLARPYADAPDTSGLALRTADDTRSLMQDALKTGVQLSIHAIGDLGNTRALDWIEAALAEVPVEERAVANPRWRIEHAQILNPQDYGRFAELGVIASMQPSHAIGDLHFAPARLGPERLEGAYAWRSLLDAGAIIAGGSDAPVEVGDPRIEFYAATVRQDLNGFSNEDWHPEQAVSRFEALRLLTYWPAYAAFQEDQLGTIEQGKRADFTVFSADLLTIEDQAILTATPVMTVVEGEIVFDGR